MKRYRIIQVDSPREQSYLIQERVLLIFWRSIKTKIWIKGRAFRAEMAWNSLQSCKDYVEELKTFDKAYRPRREVVKND